MPETKESGRRWSGYVCPECRFVFRVPRDHDGIGVVCPGCGKMLRIPGPGERLPPLVVPLKGVAREAVEQGAESVRGLKRRRKRRRSGKDFDPEWDQEVMRSQGFGLREKRQMFWMTVSGAALFALLVAAVMFAMFGGDEAEAPRTVVRVVEPPPVASAPQQKSPAALLTEAEPVIGRFLEARRIEDMLPLVRNPGIVEARMRRYYPTGDIEAPGLAEFNTGAGISRFGKLVSIVVRTRDYEDRRIAFCETPEGIKIDWESWVGWSEMPWEEFLATKPTSGTLFRLNLSEVDYFNFSFSDDEKWQSYRLVSPDGEHSIYGYVERGSILESRLRPSASVRQIALTLSLKFPENAESGNQVIIEKLIAEGWVLDGDETP